MNERDILNLIRLEASRRGMNLWRNNVGAVMTDTGSFIRFGLANDSSALNKVLKSSDLIGIKSVLITETDVGKTFGQFVSYEIKREGWEFSGNEREKAQLRWIELIQSLGGDARFINKSEDL